MTLEQLQRRTETLTAALRPQSIAILGASDNPHKVGGRPLMYLSRFGYRGRVYPINHARQTVQGFAAYHDVADLPEIPDLAVIALRAAEVPAAVDSCAARGVRATVVMASGFGETADPAGKAAEEAMVARARAAGMRIIGPNSQGLANFGAGVVVSFSTMFLEVAPANGPVAIISQSGVMSVVPYGLLRRRGIGVGHAHATGNDADVSLPELAEVVAQDPDVRLLLLYIESIRDPEALARAAAIARERDLPIVAVKSGRTTRGQAAARSHTGALASDDRVVDAFFRRHGIWRASDMHDLVNAAELYLKGWRPRGRQLVVVSNSGASGVMAADTAGEHALPLATLAPSTREALAAPLPAFASVTNPVDITAALLSDSCLLGKVLPALADEPAADLFLVAIPVAGEGYDLGAFAQDTAAFADGIGKPVVVAAPQERVRARFREAGVPTFTNQSDAIAALAQLVDHVSMMRRGSPAAVSHLKVPLPAGDSRFLNEAASLEFLEAHALPVLPHALCGSAAEAADAFRRFGPRVAMKACSAALPHKSDHGLVALNVGTATEAAATFDQLSAKLEGLNLAHEGVIVMPMARGRRELALGGTIDATFGPVVMIGDGGRYVEALNDFALLLPPFDVEDVRDALQSLRLAPYLAGVRGEPALAVDDVCAIAVRLGHILTAGARQIASFDLNPVMVGAAGEGVVIVDALIERATTQVTH